MKNNAAVPFFVILIGSLLSGYYGPWWAPSLFIVVGTAIMGLPIKKAMIIGASGLGLTFMIMAVWMSTFDQAHVIEKTGTLLGGLSPVAMVAVTTLLGMVTGFLSGWLGSVMGGVLKKDN